MELSSVRSSARHQQRIDNAMEPTPALLPAVELPTVPQAPTCVQPGGGLCIQIELAWGRAFTT
jgi:hypothetical protein